MKTKHRYSTLVEDGKVTSITWYTDEGKNHTVTWEHPNFHKIQVALNAGKPHEEIMRLFSNKQRVNEYFDSVGLFGVHFNGSSVLVNGKPVPSELSKMIIDHVDEGTDPTGLVLFFKNLLDNPSYQSRQELVSFIARHGLTITDDGHFIAYKGLRSDDTSVHSGPAVVNGRNFNGHVPNKVGNVITLPRGDVDDNRDVGCSSGLHAGTWSYANGFGHGNTARVKINPANVVSVPKDSNEQKLRVCRYEVVESKLKAPSSGLVWSSGSTSTSGATTLWKSESNTLWTAGV